MAEGDYTTPAGKSTASASISRRASEFDADSLSASQHAPGSATSEAARRRPQVSSSQTAGYGNQAPPFQNNARNGC
jgi:Ca2+:H+ antiporter